MKSLKKLNITGFCGVNQNGIKNLDLIEICIRSNNKITNVSFMESLKKIYQ